MMRSFALVLAWCSLVASNAMAQSPLPDAGGGPGTLDVMTWNIWHGGREDGDDVGPARVAEVIADSGADIVAMQETYGSGERIAEALGFTSIRAAPTCRSTVAIRSSRTSRSTSRSSASVPSSSCPIGRAWPSTRSGCRTRREIWAAGTRDPSRPETMLAACRASADDLAVMWRAIDDAALGAEVRRRPHRSSPATSTRCRTSTTGRLAATSIDAVVGWPTSRILTRHGFVDTYREANPVIDRAARQHLDTPLPRPGAGPDRLHLRSCARMARPVVTCRPRPSGAIPVGSCGRRDDARGRRGRRTDGRPHSGRQLQHQARRRDGRPCRSRSDGRRPRRARGGRHRAAGSRSRCTAQRGREPGERAREVIVAASRLRRVHGVPGRTLWHGDPVALPDRGRSVAASSGRP